MVSQLVFTLVSLCPAYEIEIAHIPNGPGTMAIHTGKSKTLLPMTNYF